MNTPKFIEMAHTVATMDPSNILIAGVGGIGCSWAHQAHQKCLGSAHLVLIDADDSSFKTGEEVHTYFASDMLWTA